jgi:hypothetical protein
MGSLIPKGRLSSALILLSLLISAGCGALPGRQGGGSPFQPVSAKETVTFGPGPFTLSDPKTGLSDLASYTATLTISFNGTVNGQTATWSRKYVMQTSKEPAMRQLTIDTNGGASGSGSTYMAELDGADFEVNGKNPCSASALEQGQGLGDTLEPAGFLNFVAGAEAAGSETVNGVAADHYTFDERELGEQRQTQSTGELWVASDGGYVVKYVLSQKAGADYFGAGMEGTQAWDYELTKAGKPFKMQLPADCPAGMVSAPLLPNPSNEVNQPGLLTYQTSASLADATAFYQKQIPGLGWQQQGKPDITDTKAFMAFKQGNEDLTVEITADSGATTVNILLVRAQK